jgi:hypothetical protein
MTRRPRVRRLRSVTDHPQDATDASVTRTSPGIILTPDISIEILPPDPSKCSPTDGKVPRAIAILVQCLHRYVEEHPEAFEIQARDTPTGRIHTITLAKE